MATLQNTDLLLLNRGNLTYKGTMAQVSEYVQDQISGGSALVLDSLDDVRTGKDGPSSENLGKFLLGSTTGHYVPVNFRAAVDAEITLYLDQNPAASGGASRIFTAGPGAPGLLDVNQDGPVDPDGFSARYKKTFLLGQNYASGTGNDEFAAVDFDTEVSTVITNYFNPNSPEFGGVEIPQELNDLFDVDYSAGIQPGDYLKYGTRGNFVEGSLLDDVTEIITNPSFPGVPADNLPKAELWDIADVDANSALVPLTDALGVVAVARKPTVGEQVLTVTNGVLDININIPDTFTYVGNVYFDKDGDPFSVEAAGSGNAFPSAGITPAVQVGDVYVALPTTTNPPTDLTVRRPLTNWPSAADPTVGVKVESGSLVVCSKAAAGGVGPLFVEMGVVDSEIVAQDLQSVLTEGNIATKDIILRGASNISLETGSFMSLGGNLYTGAGDIMIGAKSGSAGTGPVLSVPNIDFGRFPEIPTP